jgi:hypothetical protein
VAIVEKYDRKSLIPMFLIYYHHLHPLYEAESSLHTKLMKIGAWTFLGWLPMSTYPQRTLLIKEIMIFHRYKVDAKISNALWNGKRNTKPCSLLLDF